MLFPVINMRSIVLTAFFPMESFATSKKGHFCKNEIFQTKKFKNIVFYEVEYFIEKYENGIFKDKINSLFYKVLINPITNETIVEPHNVFLYS